MERHLEKKQVSRKDVLLANKLTATRQIFVPKDKGYGFGESFKAADMPSRVFAVKGLVPKEIFSNAQVLDEDLGNALSGSYHNLDSGRGILLLNVLLDVIQNLLLLFLKRFMLMGLLLQRKQFQLLWCRPQMLVMFQWLWWFLMFLLLMLQI